jgi:hypothetical protein
MNNWHTLLQFENSRHEEQAREANEYRLIHQNDCPEARPSRNYQRLLAGLGGWMILWGYRLQSRYEQITLPEITAPAPVAEPDPC